VPDTRVLDPAATDQAMDMRVEEPSLMMPGIIISCFFNEQGKLIFRAAPLQN
jgi:hypothetical protein